MLQKYKSTKNALLSIALGSLVIAGLGVEQAHALCPSECKIQNFRKKDTGNPLLQDCMKKDCWDTLVKKYKFIESPEQRQMIADGLGAELEKKSKELNDLRDNYETAKGLKKGKLFAQMKILKGKVNTLTSYNKKIKSARPISEAPAMPTTAERAQMESRRTQGLPAMKAPPKSAPPALAMPEEPVAPASTTTPHRSASQAPMHAAGHAAGAVSAPPTQSPPPSAGAGAPPPPPPPLPPAGTGGVPTPSPIHSGDKNEPLEGLPKAQEGRGDLLAAIRKGKTLNKVDETETGEHKRQREIEAQKNTAGKFTALPPSYRANIEGNDTDPTNWND